MSLDFTETNLEEIYDFSSGLSKSVEEFGFGFPFLSFKTIFNNYYIDFDLEDLVNSTDQEQEKHSIKRGDVFLTRTSETLDELAMSCVALKDYPNATFNGFTKRLRPKENKIIYPLYAIYYFRSSLFRKYVDSMATMTTRASLNNNILSKLPIFYPSYDNQIKIGNILHNLSKKIELNKQLNNNLLTISNKLYEEWFLNFEFPNDANEPYKTNNGEFYDTDLGVIPLDWEIGTLKDLIDFKNGYSFRSGDLLNNECSECYAIFKMGHIIKGGGFNPLATKSWIKKSEAPNLDKYLIKKGDLLMCMTDMKGNVALLGHTALMDVNNKYLLNQRVGLLRVSNEIGIDYPYLYLLTNHHIFLTNLRGRANSGVQVNLSTKEIKDSKIIIPSKNINQKFNNIVKPIFDIIFTNNAEILKLTKIRDTLLPKLMSGEIDVSKINCDLD